MPEIKTTSEFKPLPKKEKEICERLGKIRKYLGHSQGDFSKTIGLTNAQLANVESARVPLKFLAGWKACAIFNFNQRWLATGKPPQMPFLKTDLNLLALQIKDSALYSGVFKNVLADDLNYRSNLFWSIVEGITAGSVLFKQEEKVLVEFVAMFLRRLGSEHRKRAEEALVAALPALIKYSGNPSLKLRRQRGDFDIKAKPPAK